MRRQTLTLKPAITIKRWSMGLLLMLALSGCQTVQTASYSEGALEDPGVLPEVVRTVETFHREDLFSLVPRCVMVLPVPKTVGVTHWQAEVMEQAVARHARDVLDRVIDAAQVKRAAHAGGYDLAEQADIERLSKAARCAYVFRIMPLQLDATFAGIWSRNRIGLEIVMYAASDLDASPEMQRAIWSARHATQRADGAVPLSPLGLVSGVLAAGALKADEQEVFISLANTVARRMFATLPDMRTPMMSTLSPVEG